MINLTEPLILKKAIYIADAPFADDRHNLRLYANQIKSRTTPTNRSLFFGKDSKIPSALKGLSPDAVQMKQAQLFPIVASLGFALGGLEEVFLESSRDQDLHNQYYNRVEAEGL